MRFRSFDSLSVFRAVAEKMSFTAAGERLNMSKGAVSYQITKLERELGFELFERHHTHIRITSPRKRSQAEEKEEKGPGSIDLD
jgi:LysR family glycine cleavage system transcriptional activator